MAIDYFGLKSSGSSYDIPAPKVYPLVGVNNTTLISSVQYSGFPTTTNDKFVHSTLSTIVLYTLNADGTATAFATTIINSLLASAILSQFTYYDYTTNEFYFWIVNASTYAVRMYKMDCLTGGVSIIGAGFNTTAPNVGHWATTSDHEKKGYVVKSGSNFLLYAKDGAMHTVTTAGALTTDSAATTIGSVVDGVQSQPGNVFLNNVTYLTLDSSLLAHFKIAEMPDGDSGAMNVIMTSKGKSAVIRIPFEKFLPSVAIAVVGSVGPNYLGRFRENALVLNNGNNNNVHYLDLRDFDRWLNEWFTAVTGE